MRAIEKGKINNDRTFIKPKSFDSPAIVNWRSSREFYGKIKKSSDGTMGIFETQQMSTFFFNSIFLPTPPYRSHCPLPLAIFESTIYIYIYIRDQPRESSRSGWCVPDCSRRGRRGRFSNICSMVYENWKIESPPIFFHLADNWAARAMPPIFEPSDIVWIFIWCPSVDRCATD